MDINKLLNPSGKVGPSAGTFEAINESPSQSNRSSTTSSRVSRQSGSLRGINIVEESTGVPRYHKYATVGSSSTGPHTARSSISSLSSFLSSNSLTSLSTISSNGSISKGSLGSPIHEYPGRTAKPDFRIPLSPFDITHTGSRHGHRGVYTPSESDYSPSTTMTQYFPSYPSSEVALDRDYSDAGSLNTLAALASSHGHVQAKSDYLESQALLPSPSHHSAYEPTPPRSYVAQMRQRTDRIPKDSIHCGHGPPHDIYGVNRLQMEQMARTTHTTSAMSPTGVSGNTGNPPDAHDFTVDIFSAPKCSYTEECNTGSPLRKVVSHIFGRNKLSTRQIPKNIWVYYCRKHYQRSRYRDPKGFAKLQCDLVRRQVERLALWGGVEDWVIKVRRREEIRISKESRTAYPHSPGGSDEYEDEYQSQIGGVDAHWITMMTGSGKTIDNVRVLLHRIETEIIDRGGIFPDVEILPNVRPSALTGDAESVAGSQMPEHEHGLATIPEGGKAKKSKGLIEAFISPRRQLPSRRSLEESMVLTGSTVSAQAKLQKSNRQGFPVDLPPQAFDDDDSSSSPVRPKRKASKPLPITVMSPEEIAAFDQGFINHPYAPAGSSRDFDPNAQDSRLLKYRSKKARPGINTQIESDYHYDWARPLSPVSSIETRRHSLESDTLSLPRLAEKLEEELRSPSAEDLALASMPLSPGKATGETFCTFESKDLNIVLVTPPPSAYGECSRSNSEPIEALDGEFAELGVIEAQPVLAIDPESARTVLAVEVPQHVRDFVMGSWSKKRAVRMQHLFGDQIAKPTKPRSLRYQAGQRKASCSQTPPIGIKNTLSKRPSGTQDYVMTAKEKFMRTNVRQLRTVSFALQSEPLDESNSALSYGHHRRSHAVLTKPNPNPSPSSSTSSVSSSSSGRKKHRASSVGPMNHKTSTSSVSLKRIPNSASSERELMEQNRSWLRGQNKSRMVI